MFDWIDWIQTLDNELFLWINGLAIDPAINWFFAAITDLHKSPAFVVLGGVTLIYFSYQRFDKKWWRVVLGLIIAVGLSDIVAYRLFKKHVERPRPFQSQALAGRVHQLTGASGNSFPSNHAANCFAGAVILATAFRSRRYIFYTFAALIGFSRIYLGVHYPTDVLAGAAIGLGVGWLTALFTVIQLKHWTGLDSYTVSKPF